MCTSLDLSHVRTFYVRQLSQRFLGDALVVPSGTDGLTKRAGGLCFVCRCACRATSLDSTLLHQQKPEIQVRLKPR